ncbi:MAG: PDZ domain-containing protein [Planctomycetota bacterium]
MNQPSLYLRRYPLRVCVLGLILPACTFASAAPIPEGESLASYVPAEVGLFVEGRHIADLLLPLTDPQAWIILAEMAGQPANVKETADWRVRIQQTIQMTPAEAIDVLFSEQFAFVGEGPGRAQDAVVLCRSTVDIHELLERWRANPLPATGRTSVYRLPHRLGLALPYELAMFGDASASNGMFQHMLDFADGKRANSLAADPTYQQLLHQAPADPDAVLFARLRHKSATTSQPTSAPTEVARGADLPGPLRGADNILLALHRRGGLLHFSAIGDGQPARPVGRAGLKPLVEQLPARTLAAWGLHLDYAELLGNVNALPEQSALRLTFNLHERSGAFQRLADALGSATCLVVGIVDPQSRIRPAPPIPALAVLIDTRNPATAAVEIDTLLQSTVSIYNLLALKVGAQLALPKVTTIQLHNRVVYVLDLSVLLQGCPGGPEIAELHLCWTVDENVLILASHTDWLRQILAARQGLSPPLSGMLQLSRKAIAPECEAIIALQTGPIADLGNMWLNHLAQTAPHVLYEDWWRLRQPGGGHVRMGIQVSELAEEMRLRVTSITPNMPADGILKPGDEIVGCNRRRFATSQPVREIQQGITERKNARWIDLLVERGGMTFVRRIPLPFIDPVQSLRRLVAVGKLSQRVVYHDDVPGLIGNRGFLTIEMRPGTQPLFPMKITPAPPTPTTHTSSLSP